MRPDQRPAEVIEGERSRARAIPRTFTFLQGIKRKFLQSRAVTEAVGGIEGSDTVDHPRMTIAEALRIVTPAPGEATGGWQLAWMTAAGLFRLAVVAVGTAVEAAVRSRLGAGLALAATLVCCTASCAVRALS